MLSHDSLAQALRAAVRAQNFAATPDPLNGGRPLREPPSLDLAVIAFPRGAAPVAANLLFSREHPGGLIAPLPPRCGAQSALGYVADVQDADGRSIAWLPGADWSAIDWRPLHGHGPRVVAPYPASLFKLMLAVGVAHGLDCGWLSLDERWGHAGDTRPVRAWLFDMLAVSCNRSTSALVALAHARGLLADERDGPHALHRLFAALDLPTLRLARTRPDGGWGNAAGAGVGQLQMTAWDTVRLLWWLDQQDPDRPAPPCPWLAPDAPRLQPAGREALLAGLRGQGLDIVLSSGSLSGLPGWRPGIANATPAAWRQADGSLAVGDYRFPAGPAPRAEVEYAHKIGNTENYAADAGIVRSLRAGGRHYLIALTSNLGQRYAPQPGCAGPWGLAALGAAVDTLLHEAFG